MKIDIGKVNLVFTEEMKNKQCLFIRKNGLWTGIFIKDSDNHVIRSAASLSVLIDLLREEL